MLYLYDLNVSGDTTSIRFFSSDDALVGDVNVDGQGGVGGTESQSILRSKTYTAQVKGVFGSAFSESSFGGSFS